MLIVVLSQSPIRISFPEKRLYCVELSEQFFQYMHNERERPYKRASEILEVIEGYLKPLNSVKNCFILPA